MLKLLGRICLVAGISLLLVYGAYAAAVILFALVFSDPVFWTPWVGLSEVCSPSGARCIQVVEQANGIGLDVTTDSFVFFETRWDSVETWRGAGGPSGDYLRFRYGALNEIAWVSETEVVLEYRYRQLLERFGEFPEAYGVTLIDRQEQLGGYDEE